MKANDSVMKSILTVILNLAFLTCPAQGYETQVLRELGAREVTVLHYQSHGKVTRVEYVTQYMSKKDAQKLFGYLRDRIQRNPHYKCLNGGKTNLLFIKDGDINKSIIIALLKSVYGYRVAVAKDKQEE